MNRKELVHLYNRVGFGLTPSLSKERKKLSLKENLSLIFKESQKNSPLKIDINKYESMIYESKSEMGNKFKEQRKQIRKEGRKLCLEINHKWFEQLYNSDSLLRDKMTLFWMNHFVASSKYKINLVLDYHKLLKKNALGNFKEFVTEVSKAPLMIIYLNNKQNKKDHPNENYARELMELFTLGEGNYTETDIKESARAFTGWSHNPKRNQFIFQKKFHDFGQKTFFGKTGDFDGTDIIDIILEQKQCARFICTKIYKEFVNPTADKGNIEKMTDVFYKDYDIKKLMYFVFSSKWFYDEKNMGVKIKSPVELIVGLHNYIPFKFKRLKRFEYLQYTLGQKLFSPPNVAGWPGNKQWIDANTIMVRLKLASALIQQKEIPIAKEFEFEDTFEEVNEKGKRKGKRLLLTNVNWKAFEKQTKSIDHETLQELLISSSLTQASQEIIQSMFNKNTKDFCITCMSIPEYQMC